MTSTANTVRVIVCGSRNWNDRKRLEECLEWLYMKFCEDTGDIFVVVQGACPYGGADMMAQDWARDKMRTSNRIRLETFAPRTRDTTGFHERNQAMADAGADLCIGFTNGKNSRGVWGTGDMFSRALRAGIEVRGIPSRK